MTKIILTFVLFLFSILIFSQDITSINSVSGKNIKVTAVTIKVSVNNVTSDQGKVVFAIYNQKGFMGKPLKVLSVGITNGKAIAAFKNVVNGEYAIVSFHDKNENNDIDFSTSGMPLEDYGASRNNISFGPPQFNASKFNVKDKDLTFEIEF